MLRCRFYNLYTFAVFNTFDGLPETIPADRTRARMESFFFVVHFFFQFTLRQCNRAKNQFDAIVS